MNQGLEPEVKHSETIETSENGDAAVRKSAAQSGSGCGQDIYADERTDANIFVYVPESLAFHEIQQSAKLVHESCPTLDRFVNLHHIDNKTIIDVEHRGTGYRNGPQIKVEETALVLVPTYGDTFKVGHQETPLREHR